MVERGGLENRCTFAGTVGSNPTPSANYRYKPGHFAPVSYLYTISYAAQGLLELIPIQLAATPSPLQQSVVRRQII